jgi:hypothetical protein
MMPPRTKTIVELKQEVAKKEMLLRDTLTARLNALDAEIGQLGGPRRRGRKPGVVKIARRGAGRRGRGGKPLVAVLRDVLQKSGKGMRARDIAQAAVEAGYRSAAKDFYGIVATALRDKKSFKKLRRGVYTVV